MPRKIPTAQGARTQSNLDAMRAELDVLRSRVHAAKIAYLNRTPFENRELTYEDLRRFAADYIQKTYAYQKAAYGEVKVKISVAKLLRQR